ncbi:MAG TPA: hypothetical protein DCM86_15045 [Verrucomicrobiales bacterium]|nr:hypothetical protein [Verrucomicrobiales bacterium]
MSEIVKFVNHGAQQITPAVVEKALRQLPIWKVEFTQINAPLFPHLVDQLEFLADLVEDFAEGAYKELPYVAFAEAVFALTYANKQVGIIPNFTPFMSRADDSAVVRAVLMQNQKSLARYAELNGVDWTQITSNP